MADILIRGMENIPVGQEFVIVENIDFERYLYNRETGAAFHLVPLPEGHGEENERLKKQIVKLERKIMQMEEEAESNAAWERDIRNGQVQGAW